MTPQRFPEANTLLLRPKGMKESECSDIHAFADGNLVITCWRPSPEELVKINLGEPVWLSVVGATMPPVVVTADYPFLEQEKTSPLQP